MGEMGLELEIGTGASRWRSEPSHRPHAQVRPLPAPEGDKYCGMHGDEVAAQNRERAEAANPNTHQVRINNWGNKKALANRKGSPKWGKQ